MTKTPKNGSSSSTPTPQGGGGPGSVPAPPSVGSTKSEPIEASSLDNLGDAGTPHSLPENNLSKDNNNASAEDSLNNGTSSSSVDNLLCDNGLDNNNPGGGTSSTPDNNNPDCPGSVGAQVKSEPDMKPNCSTPSVLPPDAADLFDGFDSKDGGQFAASTVKCAHS